MKKQSNKSTWRTYRKKRNSSNLMIFPNFILPIFSQTSHSAFGFPALFRVLTSRVDRCSHLKCFTRRGRSKKFQHFRSQRYKWSLTSRCNVKGNIIGGIKGFFWLQRRVFYRQTIVKVSFTVHLACS